MPFKLQFVGIDFSPFLRVSAAFEKVVFSRGWLVGEVVCALPCESWPGSIWADCAKILIGQ